MPYFVHGVQTAKCFFEIFSLGPTCRIILITMLQLRIEMGSYSEFLHRVFNIWIDCTLQYYLFEISWYIQERQLINHGHVDYDTMLMDVIVVGCSTLVVLCCQVTTLMLCFLLLNRCYRLSALYKICYVIAGIAAFSS